MSAPAPPDPKPAVPPPRYASPPSRRELMLFRIVFLVAGLFLLAAILIGVSVGGGSS
ncbi:MAG: hypothetical protein KGK10_13070 [Rhodospirillales bacterium]|jgi:hypothetical protein|nr:hypothetical protein [Rhodospirillales bacterium]